MSDTYNFNLTDVLKYLVVIVVAGVVGYYAGHWGMGNLEERIAALEAAQGSSTQVYRAPVYESRTPSYDLGNAIEERARQSELRQLESDLRWEMERRDADLRREMEREKLYDSDTLRR